MRNRADQHQRHLRGGDRVRIRFVGTWSGCHAEEVSIDDRANIHRAGHAGSSRRRGGIGDDDGLAVARRQHGPAELHELPGQQHDEDGRDHERKVFSPTVRPGSLGDRGNPVQALVHASGQLHQVSCKCPSGKAVLRGGGIIRTWMTQPQDSCVSYGTTLRASVMSSRERVVPLLVRRVSITPYIGLRTNW